MVPFLLYRRSIAQILSSIVVQLFCFSTILGDNSYTIDGTMDLWWLEFGKDHFGPEIIKGSLVSTAEGNYSVFVAMGRERPVNDVVVYSSDGVDSLVLSADRDFLERTLAFSPASLVGYGYLTSGFTPTYRYPTIPVDDLQTLSLALRLFVAPISDSDLQEAVASLNLIQASHLVPEAGISPASYHIRSNSWSGSGFDIWVETRYPGSGIDRVEKYEYAFPGPFRDVGFIGYVLRIQCERATQSRIRISSTNQVPQQSNDVRGAPYDIEKPSQVIQISLNVTEEQVGVPPLTMAMRILSLVDVNDFRPAEGLHDVVGIQLSSANAWPSRASQEFAQTSGDYMHSKDAGRLFRWILVLALALVGLGCFHIARSSAEPN